MHAQSTTTPAQAKSISLKDSAALSADGLMSHLQASGALLVDQANEATPLTALGAMAAAAEVKSERRVRAEAVEALVHSRVPLGSDVLTAATDAFGDTMIAIMLGDLVAAPAGLSPGWLGRRAAAVAAWRLSLGCGALADYNLETEDPYLDALSKYAMQKHAESNAEFEALAAVRPGSLFDLSDKVSLIAAFEWEIEGDWLQKDLAHLARAVPAERSAWGAAVAKVGQLDASDDNGSPEWRAAFRAFFSTPAPDVFALMAKMQRNLIEVMGTFTVEEALQAAEASPDMDEAALAHFYRDVERLAGVPSSLGQITRLFPEWAAAVEAPELGDTDAPVNQRFGVLEDQILQADCETVDDAIAKLRVVLDLYPGVELSEHSGEMFEQINDAVSALVADARRRGSPVGQPLKVNPCLAAHLAIAAE